MAKLSEEEFLEIANLHNPRKFSDAICDLVRNEGLGYMDAIIDYCGRHDIDTDMDIPTQLEGSELALGQMWAHVRDEVDKNIDEVLNEGSSK